MRVKNDFRPHIQDSSNSDNNEPSFWSKIKMFRKKGNQLDVMSPLIENLKNNRNGSRNSRGTS